MSRLILPGDPRWPNRQIKPPYGSVEIDWAHPLARGVRSYWLLNEGASKTRDLGPLGCHAVRGGTFGAWAHDPRGGAAYTFPGSGTSGFVSENTITCFDETDEHTFIARFRYAAQATAVRVWLDLQASGIGTAMCNYGASPVLYVRGYSGFSLDTTTLVDGAWYTFIAVYKGLTGAGGKNRTRFISSNNRVPRDVDSAAVNTWTPGAATPRIGHNYNGGYETTSTFSLVGYWGRGLSDDEAQLVIDSPYCFLRPVVRRSYGFVGGGAPPADPSGYMRLGKYWW